MGKLGPCCHCGVASTPLWRNGPANKPVLCNACGSRWRTKGSLANYIPLHARAEPEDYEVNKLAKAKVISITKQKEVKLLRRKQFYEPESRSVGGVFSDNRSFSNFMDQEASNRSSRCGQFNKVEPSEVTDPDKSFVSDSLVTPSRKIGIPRWNPSPVKKLTRDLYTILREQQSFFSRSSEEDLLFDTATPVASVETGHGSTLIKYPNSVGQEEEFEVSSLKFDKKACSGQRSDLTPNNLPVNFKINDSNIQNLGLKKSINFTDLDVQQEQRKRSKLQNEKFQILGNHKSPLCTVDLKDIFNDKEFATYLTSEEHHHLLNYLPPTDVASYPDSIINMFDSAQFTENLSSFHQLLAEGVFDLSFSGVQAEDCKTLRRLSLSKWVEDYNLLKRCKNGVASGNIANVKRPRDTPSTDVPESTRKCTKKESADDMDENKAPLNNTASCSSLALHQDSSSIVLDSVQYADGDGDDDGDGEHDLLLDMPLNNAFPQAELLLPASSFGSLLTSSCSSAVYPYLIRH